MSARIDTLVTVFGGSGFLGRHVIRELARRDYRIRVGVRRPELAGHLQPLGRVGQIHPVQANVRYPASVQAAARGASVVVNLVGILAQSGAQTFEAVQDKGAETVAQAAADIGARMVHVSAIGADANSTSAYARTKAAGEWAVRGLCPQSWVVRTAWLYGAAGPTGFPKAMKRLAAARDSLTVVSDQVGQPTWTHDLAEAIVRLVESEAPYGMWHGTGSGQCSWFDFARATFEELGLDPERVQPITSAEYAAMYPAAAARPAYSVLSHERWEQAGIAPLPEWRDALHRAAPTVLAD